MSDDEYSQSWSRDAQKRGILLWISFLTACLGAVLFFALVDPLLIVEDLSAGRLQSREAGYALMFFFIWLCTFVSAALSLRLARRKRQQPRRIGTGASNTNGQ